MLVEQWRGWFARFAPALLGHVTLLILLIPLGTGCGPMRPAQSAAPTTLSPQTAEAGEPAIAVGQLASGELPSAVPIEADDVSWGVQSAPVTLVAFVDYECSFCARAHGTVKALQQQYGEQRLRVVLKHLPLDFHANALPAAIAMQAVRELLGHASALNYADKLLGAQHALAEANLVNWAVELGVDRGQFQARLSDPGLLAAVNNDAALARRHGIDGTPTFLVNGFELVGAQPLSEFQQVVDKELDAAKAMRTAGVAAEEVYALRVKANLEAGADTNDEDVTVYRVPVDGSPTLGPADALVTIVEFSEFECPFCERVRPTLERLRQRFSKDVRLVFKHLPLDFHKQALPAARLSAEIHRIKGDAAFWEAAAALFEGTLTEQELIELGKRYGLSEAQARNAISGSAGRERVERDLNLSDDLQARGTPHFFINGRRLAGARPYQEFELLVLRSITEAKQSLAAGVAPVDYYAHLMGQAEPLHAPREVTRTITNVDHPSWGRRTAPVVIHAFSDFECNFCARVEPTLAELRQLFPTQLKIVWHNLPLPSHEAARPAAAAAMEAYAQQGNTGFHRMHAALFGSHRLSEGPRLSPSAMLTHAKNQGLDLARFEAALADGRHDAAIEADRELAESLGIDGTPGFVIDRWLVTGAKPLRYFRALVERALAPRD